MGVGGIQVITEEEHILESLAVHLNFDGGSPNNVIEFVQGKLQACKLEEEQFVFCFCWGGSFQGICDWV